MIPWFFVVLLLIGMLVHMGLGLHSRRFRRQSVQLPFEILMYICVLWTATYALDISSNSLAYKILLMKIRFLGLPFISLDLMLITILFTGRGNWLTVRRMALLLIIPVCTVFLALTTEYSTVFRYNYALAQTSAGFSTLGFTNGIWTLAVYLPFNYIVEAASLLLLMQAILVSRNLSARQAMLLFVAILIPATADLLFFLGITPVKNYNVAPSTFAFTGVLLAIALFWYRFIEIMPVARNTLFERMSDPMLVIDREGALADINPAAEKALGLGRTANIGKNALDALHEHVSLCACIRETQPACNTISIGEGTDERVFDFSIKDLASDAGVLPDKLVLLRDVTDRKRAEVLAVHLASFPELNAMLILEADPSGSILYANPSIRRFLEAMGESDPGIFIPPEIKNRLKGTAITQFSHEVQDIEVHGRIIREDVFFTPEFSSLRIYASDVTDYRLMEKEKAQHSNQIQMLLELHLHANESPDAIMDFVLEAILKTTQSRYSWFGLLDEDESVMTIYRWSKDAMADCITIKKPIRYPVAEAGLWGECIRQRKPLLINDYDEPHPGKKGIPEGHISIRRLLVIPIFEGEGIVAAVAVANKDGDYTKTDEDGLTSLISKMWAILKRKEAEEALQVSEEKFKKAFFTSPDSVSINRLSDGMFVLINNGFFEITGYTEGEIVGKSSLEINIWKNEEDRRNVVEKLLDKGEVRDYEARFNTKKGEIDGLVSASIIELDGVPHILTITRDITKNKKAEDALKRSREKYYTLFNSMQEGAALHELVYDEMGQAVDYKIVDVNPKFESILNISRDMAVNKLSTQAYGTSLAPYLSEYTEVARSGIPKHFETFFAPLNKHLDISVSPWGRNGFATIFSDINERKRWELALKEIESAKSELLEKLNEAQQIAITGSWEWNLQTDSVWWSDETYRIFGVSSQDFSPSFKANGKFIHPDDFGRYCKSFEHSLQTGEPLDFEFRLIANDGLEKHCHSKGKIINDDSGRTIRFVGTITDITKRKIAQDELARHSRRLMIINRLDRVLTTSLDMERMYDAFVKNLKELVPLDRTSIILLDESREHCRVAMIWTGNELIIGKGEWRDIIGSAITWLVNQKRPLIENEIGENGDWMENEPLRQEGIRSRVLLPLIIRDEVMGALYIASRQPAAYSEKDLDILMPLSDQFSLALQNSRLYDQLKQQSLELERIVEERTDQLQKANKELEAFSYSVSHDLRTPLRAVDGFSRILLEEYISELSPEAQHYLNLVRSNAEQMGQLIDDLLTFSRTSRQPLAKRSVNHLEIVNQVIEELHSELEGRMVNFIIGDLPSCAADPPMLKRIYFNIISNSVKFTRNKEVAQIEIGSIINEEKTTYFVKDNGIGFDMRYSNKLFGVFQRLHSESEYEGTGVGLALVQRIVHRHGGRVWAESEVDKGATFYFTLEGGGSP